VEPDDPGVGLRLDDLHVVAPAVGAADAAAAVVHGLEPAGGLGLGPGVETAAAVGAVDGHALPALGAVGLEQDVHPLTAVGVPVAPVAALQRAPEGQPLPLCDRLGRGVEPDDPGVPGPLLDAHVVGVAHRAARATVAVVLRAPPAALVRTHPGLEPAALAG